MPVQLPGGYKAGDVVYSLINHENVKQGHRGVVKGPCNNKSIDDAGSRVLITWDGGTDANYLTSQFSKASPVGFSV